MRTFFTFSFIFCALVTSFAFERDPNRGEFHLEQDENVRAAQQAQQGRYQELGYVPQNDRQRSDSRTNRSDQARNNLSRAEANRVAKGNLVKAEEASKKESGSGAHWFVFAGLAVLFIGSFFGFKAYSRKFIPAMPERRKKKRTKSVV